MGLISPPPRRSTPLAQTCPSLVCAGLRALALPAPSLGSMWQRQSQKSLSHGSGEQVLVPVLSVTLGRSRSPL